MKVRVRTAIEGPNRRGKYRAVLIVDGKRHSASPWLTEKNAIGRIDEARAALLSKAKATGLTVTFNPGHRTLRAGEL